MDSGSKTEEVISYNSNTAKKARLQSMLSALLEDPILSDVPKKPMLADVDTLINLELGSAMKISVVKMDNTSFDVAVLNSANVKDLKLAIRKKTNEIEQAQMGHRHISWGHVWANFCLTHHNEKLIDDNSLLSDHGIRNNSKVSVAGEPREQQATFCFNPISFNLKVFAEFHEWLSSKDEREKLNNKRCLQQLHE